MFAALRQRLEALPTDFAHLLDRHVPLHGALFNRVTLDLGGAQEREQASEELLASARQQSGGLPPVLFEPLFQAGRYAIISSCGKQPPTLQGIWTGTWTPACDGRPPSLRASNSHAFVFVTSATPSSLPLSSAGPQLLSRHLCPDGFFRRAISSPPLRHIPFPHHHRRPIPTTAPACPADEHTQSPAWLTRQHSHLHSSLKFRQPEQFA